MTLSNSAATKDGEELTSLCWFCKKVKKVQKSMYAMKGRLQASTRLSHIQRCSYQFNHHVLSTMRCTSPALKILRTPNGESPRLKQSSGDPVLVTVYLLLVLDIFIVAQRGFCFAVEIMYNFWYSVNTVFVIMKWCLWG